MRKITKKQTAEKINSTVIKLHKSGAYHKKRGFKLSDSDRKLTSNHLLEEVVEFQAELFFGDYKHQISEAADVLAVYLHSLYVAGIPFEEVIKATDSKLVENFTTSLSEVLTTTPGKLRRNRQA